MYFIYYPNQVGNWSLQFSYPGNSFTFGNLTVKYKPATSQVVAFTVQKDLVRIGFDPVSLPTGYWTRPINAENREWYTIAGNSFDDFNLMGYKAFTTGPETAHIVWNKEVSIGGLIGGEYGSLSALDGGGSIAATMFGKIFYNTAAGTFVCVDEATGKVLYEKPGSVSKGIVDLTANLLSTAISGAGQATSA
jgi:hypothetical protein